MINCDKYVYSSVTGKIAAQKLDDFFDKHIIVRYANSDDDDDDDDEDDDTVMIDDIDDDDEIINAMMISFHPSFNTSIHPLTHSPIHLFFHPLTHSSIHSFIHPFIYSSTHPFIHPFIYSFIYSFIHLFIHSLTERIQALNISHQLLVLYDSLSQVRTLYHSTPSEIKKFNHFQSLPQ